MTSETLEKFIGESVNRVQGLPWLPWCISEQKDGKQLEF